MIDGYKVITLCGSTKFKDYFIKAQKDLTLQGYIVLSVGMFSHSGDELPNDEQTKKMLADLHKKKIDMSDEIMVINVDSYIGESTKSEILYAAQQGKVVRYLFTCFDCENYTGIGDWSLSCKETHSPKKFPVGHLCHSYTPICEKYKPITKLSEQEFLDKFCYKCGTQRCEGIGTEWFDGCQYKRYLKEEK